ncbi:hypothetical protein AB0B54_16545 [Microbispora bryophytorum]
MQGREQLEAFNVRGAGLVLYGFEIEPEVRKWLDDLGDSDFKRVDEAAR